MKARRISRYGAVLLAAAVFAGAINKAAAQLWPAEGQKLHYRIIGFIFPATSDAGSYKLEIAAGTINDAETFRKHIIVTENSKTNRLIAEVPDFAAEYTWRVTSKRGKASETQFHHFNTFNPDTISNPTILRVRQRAEKYKDAYVFLDQARALFDMNGKPVWYMPVAGEAGSPKVPVRDLKMSPQGTITYVREGEEIYEINYDGNVLWKGPNDGAVSGTGKEHYHHELTRLSNGHYMTMGSAPPSRISNMPRPDNFRPGIPMHQAPSDTAHKSEHRRNIISPFGTIIEYDEKGNVVWSWKSSSYFLESDILLYTDADGQRIADVHLNSFYFDEKRKVIYASFKNISRIVKISYPEGKVLATYGEVYVAGEPAHGNGMYCYQHALGITSEGDLYLFNNNSCNPTCYPEILVLREPAAGESGLKKKWEYECPVQSLSLKRPGQQMGKGDGTTGGNVVELPDHSFFISLCAPYSMVLIVNREKEILWNAEPARWNPTGQNYSTFPQYRSSIITSRSDLERLIWNSQH